MVVQIKVSGDPRRPNEIHKWKPMPPTAEDQTPVALQVIAMGLSIAALLLKLRLCSWAAVVCIVMSVANINSADLDMKSVMSSGSFAIMGLAAAYLAPNAPGAKS